MMERIRELEGTISASTGWKIRRELAGLARTYRLFLGNDRELQQYLVASRETQRVLELWDVRNRNGFERFLDEIDRLLHNYVAAAATLRDHTRRVWEKHLTADAALVAEYERRVAETFATAPVSQFVQALRNYTLHHRLAVARGRLSMTAGKFDSAVVLGRSELLKWDGWPKPARAYLEAAARDIRIGGIVTEYTKAVTTFNDWFGHSFVGAHLPAFDDLARLEQELAAAYEATVRR
jgi:hypothetical protein